MKEGETGQRQASERERSPKTLPSTTEEVYVSRTQDIEQSGRRDEGGSEGRNLDESKRVERVERNLKSQVGEFKFLAFLKTMQSLRVFQRLLTC